MIKTFKNWLRENYSPEEVENLNQDQDFDNDLEDEDKQIVAQAQGQIKVTLDRLMTALKKKPNWTSKKINKYRILEPILLALDISADELNRYATIMKRDLKKQDPNFVGLETPE